MTFLNVPTQPLLEIPSDLHQAAWNNRSSSAPAWWNTYLNQVCLQTLVPWLQSELDPTAQSEVDRTTLQSLWQLVNGIALTVTPHRLIVIPDKTIETDEFRVPQEWIDLPSWAGDYYLAAQVNPDDASILIWGYATHRQFKTQGEYDADDRTYRLSSYDLVRDFSALSVMRQLGAEEVTRAEIAPIPSLSATQAEQLIQRLANPAILLPRLEIPFQLWGALLEAPHWRQQLGQLRLGQTAFTTRIVNLRQWLQNTVDQSWQTLETLFGDEPTLDYQFRQSATTAVQRIKVLELEEQSFWLFVSIEPEENDRYSIRVQLRSTQPDAILPSGITLTLLNTSGVVVQSVEARDRDNGIQLRRFRCSTGTQFNLQIAIGANRLIEEFTV